MTNYPVDLVYLWCNDSDPAFHEKKARLLERHNKEFSHDSIADIRFKDSNELLFSLRSVWENLSWINHIYIITDNQTPTWMKKHPLVTIVDHKEIIPNHLLPTFNSNVIETYIDKIPNLSEHFIYLNDDMIILEKLNVSDFFDSNGIPIVRLTKAKRHVTHGDVEKQLASSNKSFLSTLQIAWLLFCEKNQREIPFDTFSHSCDSYTKSIWKKCMIKYPEIYKHNTSTFRSYDEIQRLILSYEMVYCFGSKKVYIRTPNFLNRVLRLFKTRKIWVSCRQSVRKIIRDIKFCHPQTVCVNAVDNDRLFNIYFNSVFPSPAPWEREYEVLITNAENSKPRT